MTDSDLIAHWLKKHKPTICPPAVMYPSDQIDAAKLQPLRHQARMSEANDLAIDAAIGWKSSRARSKGVKALRRISMSNMKSNKIGAKI